MAGGIFVGLPDVDEKDRAVGETRLERVEADVVEGRGVHELRLQRFQIYGTNRMRAALPSREGGRLDFLSTNRAMRAG
ncbi:hypothetical protein SS37A_06330 [Methylocystis iwaonis]|uniref:Uncharacterized protein n=1 Tax=Methylocystis iwaonis TaxID=2885079 RepID=A0ABM8E5J7_9HYPH|nr:hypothetical protein SS37A_06330 [Methylocystis iwaonis]